MTVRRPVRTLSPSALRRRAAKIRLFAMDVDGVLTDGGILVLNSGEEVKIWNVKDRIAFFVLKSFGERFPVAWITGRKSAQVAARAKEIGAVALYQHSDHKGRDLDAVRQKLGLAWDNVLFIGDDWVDLPALRRAGLAICPSDAHPSVKAACHWVARAPGGRGVLREVADLVLESQSLMAEVLERFENPQRRPNP